MRSGDGTRPRVRRAALKSIIYQKKQKKHSTAAAQLSGRRSTIYPEREVGVKAEKASEAENVDFWRGSVNKGPV